MTRLCFCFVVYQALLFDEPRKANCVASGPVNCFRLGRDDFNSLFGDLQDILSEQMRLRVLKVRRILIHHLVQSAAASHRVFGWCVFSQTVPALNHLSDKVLEQVARAMETRTYSAGEYIVRQGDRDVHDFFIIIDGEARCTTRNYSGEVRRLEQHDFFGERSLVDSSPSVENVVAASGKVDCFVIGKADFDQLVGSVVPELREDCEDSADDSLEEPDPSELQRMWTLGTGTFGRVYLCQHQPTSRVMALKAMQKQQIWESHQLRNTMNEKHLLQQCHHPLVLELIGTYQDRDCIYMLLEMVQGGGAPSSLWRVTRVELETQ